MHRRFGKDGSPHLSASAYVISPSGSIILFYLCLVGLSHGNKLTNVLFLALASNTQLLSAFLRWIRKERGGGYCSVLGSSAARSFSSKRKQCYTYGNGRGHPEAGWELWLLIMSI